VSRGARARLAVGGLVAAALLSSGASAVELVRLVIWHGAADPLAAYESRFAELRRWLPPFGAVGYVSDRPDVRELYLTQYSLAPVVVDPSGHRELIVGNFFDAGLGAQLVERGGLVVRDFGEGLVLLRRRDR
jgi:hypothetical protein